MKKKITDYFLKCQKKSSEKVSILMIILMAGRANYIGPHLPLTESKMRPFVDWFDLFIPFMKNVIHMFNMDKYRFQIKSNTFEWYV